MIEEKQSVGKEYMEHAKNADDMWLAQRMSEGQQKSLCSWIWEIRLIGWLQITNMEKIVRLSCHLTRAE